MPRPKKIKNLLKAIDGHSSDTSVGNYVQLNDTPQSTRQQITKSTQPHFGSPLPQEFGHTPPQISQSAQPRNLQPTFESSSLPQTKSAQPHTSKSTLPHTSESTLPHTSDSVLPHTSDSALPHTSDSTLPHASESAEPHTPQPTQPHTSESEAERVPPRKGRQSNHYWFIDTIDEHGVTQKMKLKVRDAHNLPSGIRVVVDYDDNFQPIREACGLLAGVCGQLAGNHILLPISFESWSSMPDTYKDTIWESKLKINEDLAKRDVMFKIGKLWREYRCKLWNEFYDPLLSRNDLIKNIPDGLSMEQWAIFVDYRLKPSTVKLCNRNRDIRKKQTIPHTGGAMPLSRRRDNLRIETGRNIDRAEMNILSLPWVYIVLDYFGLFWAILDVVFDYFLHCFGNILSLPQEKIDELMLQNPDTASDISPNDPVGVILGKEHPGRVRGLSYGACPTLAFKKSTTRLSNMNHGSSSGGSSTNVEEKVDQMATELAIVKSQMHTLLAYIASRPDVPEHLAAMAANLVQPSINEAPDVGSDAPSPNQNIRSSGDNKTN
ncbi:uncharacterized protein [Phaseolus vulgaris]|uniref:uncharacterized protein n=1 Tax=Phaseolus vulgaris TaxID=3885 RepID=UPI0035CB33CF